MSQLSPTLSPLSVLDASSVSSASAVSTPTAPVIDTPGESLAPTEENAPEPLGQQTAAVHQRLERLLERAAVNGMPGLNASLSAALNRASERPGLFEAGRSEYKAMEAAAEACDLAGARLAKTPLSAFQKQPMDEAAFKVLSDYTAAQNAMFSCIQAFTAKSERFSPLMETLAQATQFRASEALNLAATLMKGEAPEESATMGEGMARLSPQMHGHRLRDALSTEAAQLLNRLDELERRTDLSPADFEAARTELAEGFRSLKERMQGLADTAASGLQADRSLSATLLRALDGSAQRLANLQGTTRNEVKLKAAERFLDLGVSLKDAEAAKFPGFLKRSLTGLLGRYEVDCRIILTRIGANARPSEIKSSMIEAVARLHVGQLPNIMSCLNRVAEGNVDIQAAGKRLEELGLSRKEAGELFAALKDEGTRAFVGKFSSSLANMPKDIFLAEVRSMERLLEAADERFALRGEYLSLAVEHSIDLNTVVEARLRGFPPESMETRAVEGAFVSAKILGQGAANTVELCRFVESEGVELKKVFKPEREARMGLARLRLSRLGYSDDTQTMKLNVASCVAADAIGCGGVISRSTIGTHNGKFGLFMEAAPGCTAHDVMRGGACGSLPDGTKLNWKQTVSRLKKNGNFEAMQANLMRECCRMEWADLLSGQVDRHYDNYLLHIDAETGAVKITGIDNDGSFSEKKVGMTKVDVSTLGDEEIRLLERVGMELKEQDGRKTVANAPQPDQYQLGALRKLFGFNQFFRPSHIDRDTFNKITALDENEYRRSLTPYMDEKAVDAAVLRLRDAKAHAIDLEARGRVVDDWTASSDGRTNMVFQQIRNSAPPRTDGDGHRLWNYHAGFFARDLMQMFR